MKNRNRIVYILCLMLLFALTVGGCGNSVDLEAIDADQQIVLSGLEDADTVLTIGDLAELECVTQKAEAPRSNGEIVSVEAVGPLMDTLLAQYGKKQTDFTRIRFTATDGYSIAYEADILENRDIILVIEDGGEALKEDAAPLRIIVPGERAMYWAKKICRIDFEMGEAGEQCKQIVMVEGAAPLLEQKALEGGKAEDKAVSAEALIKAYVDTKEDQKMTLTAADGLKKSETTENFFKGLLKYAGEDSPHLVGDIPEGMRVSNLVWIGCGDTMFVSMPQLIALAGKDEALNFSELLKQAGFASAESYAIYGVDGTPKTYEQAELANAYFKAGNAGETSLYLGEGGAAVANVLRIEAK